MCMAFLLFFVFYSTVFSFQICARYLFPHCSYPSPFHWFNLFTITYIYSLCRVLLLLALHNPVVSSSHFYAWHFSWISFLIPHHSISFLDLPVISCSILLQYLFQIISANIIPLTFCSSFCNCCIESLHMTSLSIYTLNILFPISLQLHISIPCAWHLPYIPFSTLFVLLYFISEDDISLIFLLTPTWLILFLGMICILFSLLTSIYFIALLSMASLLSSLIISMYPFISFLCITALSLSSNLHTLLLSSQVQVMSIHDMPYIFPS